MLLDVRELCFFADYFVICSGDTQRHVEAIWQNIEGEVKSKGGTLYHGEGTPDSGWMLGDYGSILVHIFTQEKREYYQLDQLWGEATPVIRIQ